MPINATVTNYELPNADFYNTARSIPALAKQTLAFKPTMSSFATTQYNTPTNMYNGYPSPKRSAPTLNPIHIPTVGCTTYIMDANYRPTKPSTNTPNNFSKLLNPTCSIP
jgi:hypothetical protein